MTAHLTCINCPIGCCITVTMDPHHNIQQIEGAQCKRGQAYAQTELTDPRRVVTSTVRVANAMVAQLPVKTSIPIPKDKIMACMAALKPVDVAAPIYAGDVILSNVCGTGADIIATKSMPSIQERHMPGDG